MKIVIVVISIFLIFACKDSKRLSADEEVFGKYTTKKSSFLEKRFLSDKYGDYFYRKYIMVLNLEKDHTFTIGFCNRKIYASGIWEKRKTGIFLDSMFEYPSQMYMESILLRQLENGDIFYPAIRELDDKPGLDTTITVLSKGGKDFDGILTNQYWMKESK